MQGDGAAHNSPALELIKLQTQLAGCPLPLPSATGPGQAWHQHSYTPNPLLITHPSWGVCAHSQWFPNHLVALHLPQITPFSLLFRTISLCLSLFPTHPICNVASWQYTVSQFCSISFSPSLWMACFFFFIINSFRGVYLLPKSPRNTSANIVSFSLLFWRMSLCVSVLLGHRNWIQFLCARHTPCLQCQ